MVFGVQNLYPKMAVGALCKLSVCAMDTNEMKWWTKVLKLHVGTGVAAQGDK